MTLQYILRHRNHAIGNFTASLEFANGLLASQFSPVAARMGEIATDLGLLGRTPPGQMIRFGPAELQEEPPAMPTGYQRFAPDGSPEAILICDSDSINLSLFKYERWEVHAPQIVDTFSSLADAYLPAAGSVKGIKLQYLNEFAAASEAVQSSSELFKKGSKWIAPFALETDEFWHCHIGRFIPIDDHQRNLVNVNCDILQIQASSTEPGRRHVKVLVLAACYYNLNREGLELSNGDLKSKLAADLKAAHALERETLAEVISDDYLEIMGAMKHDY